MLIRNKSRRALKSALIRLTIAYSFMTATAPVLAIEFTDANIDLVRRACLAGDKFKFFAEADGSLSIRSLQGKGHIKIDKEDNVTTVDVPDDDKRAELGDIRQCIKEYFFAPRTETVTETRKFAESEDIPSGATALSCLTGFDTKGDVAPNTWLQGPRSPQFSSGADGMTTSIQFGYWSNTPCGISGNGWHAKVGTCGTGQGSGWHRCTVVEAKVTETRTVRN